MQRSWLVLAVLIAATPALAQVPATKKAEKSAKQPTAKNRDPSSIAFSITSLHSGAWSDPQTWQPARVPRQDDRVRISRGTRVVYDAKSKDVIRLLQVVGTLT